MSAVVAAAPDVSKWDAWTPKEVVEILSEVDAPWYVAGGWAIDLFLGGERRPHADLEIAVPKRRFGEVAQALARYELYVVADGEPKALEEAAAALETTHQTWVWEPTADSWRLDVFREQSSADVWIYRRDDRIRLSYERVIRRTDDGIPYGSPEVILLFKAANADEAKHRDDFVAALPFVDAEGGAWLIDALELAHPTHPWLAELRRSSE